MSRKFVPIPILLSLCASLAPAQDIEIHSEFQRYNPRGLVVLQDRELNPREILSPAVPRNGHLTVQVVITGPTATNFFLYAGANPPDTLKVTIYRQHFVPCGADYCPDWLTEVPSSSFGAIPEPAAWLPGQTSRSYIFDIWVPHDVPPRRVRIEALMKTGIWNVAPMEVRVIEPTVPDVPANVPRVRNAAPVTDPASATAHLQFLRFMNGQPPQLPPAILHLSDLLQRNAAEDMLLAGALNLRPQLNLFQWTPFVFPQAGPEWYLRVRDFIYRYNP